MVIVLLSGNHTFECALCPQDRGMLGYTDCLKYGGFLHEYVFEHLALVEEMHVHL